MQIGGVEVERLDEPLLPIEAVQVIGSRKLIHAEDADVLGLGCLDDLAVTGVLADTGDAGFAKPVHACIATLDPDREAVQTGGVRDPGDAPVGIDTHPDGRIGAGKVVQSRALGRFKDRIDHIRLAIQDPMLCGRKVRRNEFHLDAGFLLPQLPLVHEVALRLAIGPHEQVRRIVVVPDDAERLRSAVDRKPDSHDPREPPE